MLKLSPLPTPGAAHVAQTEAHGLVGLEAGGLLWPQTAKCLTAQGTVMYRAGQGLVAQLSEPGCPDLGWASVGHLWGICASVLWTSQST